MLFRSARSRVRAQVANVQFTVVVLAVMSQAARKRPVVQAENVLLTVAVVGAAMSQAARSEARVRVANVQLTVAVGAVMSQAARSLAS